MIYWKPKCVSIQVMTFSIELKDDLIVIVYLYKDINIFNEFSGETYISISLIVFKSSTVAILHTSTISTLHAHFNIPLYHLQRNHSTYLKKKEKNIYKYKYRKNTRRLASF